MQRVRSFRSSVSVGIGALLTAVFVIAACGKKDEGSMEGTADEPVKYTLGQPIQDSSIALIVTSPAGTDTLKAAQYREQYNSVLQRYPLIQGNADQAAELKRSIVDNFVLGNLIQGEIKKRNINPDTAEVGEQLRGFKQRVGGEAAFQQQLQQSGMTEDSLRSQIVEFLRQQAYQKQLIAAVQKPTAPETETFRKEQAEEVRAQHILFLVKPGASKQQEDSVKTLAQAVLDTVKKGKVPFEDLAKRHSQDPGSAQAGGDLNYFPHNAMVPEFEKAAFALKDSGDVAQNLIKTQYGYHIIRLTGRRQAELMDTTRANAMIMQKRSEEAIRNELDRLKKTATIRVNPKIIDVDVNQPRKDD